MLFYRSYTSHHSNCGTETNMDVGYSCLLYKMSLHFMAATRAMKSVCLMIEALAANISLPGSTLILYVGRIWWNLNKWAPLVLRPSLLRSLHRDVKMAGCLGRQVMQPNIGNHRQHSSSVNRYGKLVDLFDCDNSRQVPLWCYCRQHIAKTFSLYYKHGLTLIPSWISNHTTIKCRMKLCIHFQTSMVQPLKFGNG